MHSPENTVGVPSPQTDCRVTQAGVFSYVVFEASDASHYAKQAESSYDRLNLALQDPAVRRTVGEGWQIKYSTQDTAIFVHPGSNQVHSCEISHHHAF